MATVSRVDVLAAQLPFRFSFAHALAVRASSSNVYVKITLDDGTVGFGEGVPREYVTGETVESALAALCHHWAPALLGGLRFTTPDEVPPVLETIAGTATGGAAWCAVELALLDAAGRQFGCSASVWLGAVRPSFVRYTAVIPFLRPARLAALAAVIRALGFAAVKLKVGNDVDADMRALRLLRRILGRDVNLRIDANAAWSAEQAIDVMERIRAYGVSAVEQPVRADDLEGLRRVTAAIPEMVIVDESLRTVEEARLLARSGACGAFNIRVSKCGGLLQSVRIARVAEDAGLVNIVGAQVGESALLSAAGRHLAAAIRPMHVEGSAGRLLLKQDLTRDRVLPGWGGRGRIFDGPGLGVQVEERTLRKHTVRAYSFKADGASIRQAS